ncbi:MAP7 domain-containing protein 3 [Apodemus speciosus]|uniref:MAP7 domain-containing protein 3 n=1 Tax=Apodemus speciosus TaxID=105296 RepID=A0ABQ0FU76_APOSI
MADPTIAGTSNSTSLRGLRERLVAMAQELAEERRRKRGTDSSAVINKRSSCTPVLDGSVLKNDVKQQLAKERREQRKRQQEANKEKQLFEKEQKAKLLYEKQLEEKLRKLKEQKEKDERRRASAEEKRKQKQAEDKVRHIREKFKAVVTRTMERCNLIDQRQKRWSWEGGAMNADKSGKTENKRSSSLSRKDNRSHPSGDAQHVDDTPSTNKYVFRYVSVPMFTSDELKSSAMFCKPSRDVIKYDKPVTKKLESSLKGVVEGAELLKLEIPPKIKIEVPSPTKLEEPAEANVEVKPQNMEGTSEVKEDVSHKVDTKVPTDENIATHPKPNVEELPSVSVGTSSSVEQPPRVSGDSPPSLSAGSSSFASVEISPVVSIDTSETSIDTSPELSMDSGSTEVAKEVKKEAPLKAGVESHLEASVEGHPEANVEGSPKVQNAETNKRNIIITIKKQPPCHIPCYRWPSSPSLGCHPPSPLKALQNRKIRPPSPIPVSSRLSMKTSLSYKITPVQNMIYVPNALGIIATKKETIQKPMIKREVSLCSPGCPGTHSVDQAGLELRNPPVSAWQVLGLKKSANKSMPTGEAAKKALIQVQHAAYEPKSKKEKERVEKEEVKQSIARKPEVMAEKLNEVPAKESSPPSKDKQQEKDPTKTLLESPEDKKEQLQWFLCVALAVLELTLETRLASNSEIHLPLPPNHKGDSAMMKSQDNAEQRKKEQEKIMLQHWQERFERRKALEMSSSSEDEADDEGETGSDDSLEMFPSGGKTFSLKLKKFHKYSKTKPQKLVFLQAGTGEVDTDKNVYFNGNMKAVKQKDPRYSTIQGKGPKLPAKKPPTRPTRSRKIKEGGTTIRPTQSVTTNHEWVCDNSTDLSQTTESPVLTTSPSSSKQSPTDCKISYQGPQAHLDQKKRAKSVSAPLTKVLSHLHIAGRATNLGHPFASSYSRLAFGGEAEESAMCKSYGVLKIDQSSSTLY